MSYEGREQHICENGHLFEIDCQYSFSEDNKVICNYCEAFSAWVNYVDDTNGECNGEILPEEFEKLKISADKYQECNLGHQHLIHRAIYRLPKENELKKTFMSRFGQRHPIEEYNKYYGI